MRPMAGILSILRPLLRMGVRLRCFYTALAGDYTGFAMRWQMPDPITLPTPASALIKDGKPTQALLELLQEIKDALDDHEARIIVLEP